MSVLSKAATALGLASTASAGEVLAAIDRLKRPTDPAETERLLLRAVDLGVGSRRLLRIQRPWAEAYAAKDWRGFIDYLEGAPEVGFESAVEEFSALVRRRVEDSGRKLEFSAALESAARARPTILAEVRSRLEFAASAAVSEENTIRQLAREHPALVEAARELVAASGTPIDVGEAQRLVAAEHPALYAEVQAEGRAQMRVTAEPRVLDGPVAQEFGAAVEDVMWADGVDWSEAARRVDAARPDLSERLERERRSAAPAPSPDASCDALAQFRTKVLAMVQAGMDIETAQRAVSSEDPELYAAAVPSGRDRRQ